MYYFAYGSNMDTNNFIKFISNDHIKIIGPAYINNHILRYRKIKTSKKNSGVANIEPRIFFQKHMVLFIILMIMLILNYWTKKRGYIK